MREEGAKTMKNGTKLHGAILFPSVLLLAVCLWLASPARALDVQLQPTDCVKCHQDEPAWINANGGKHKTEITCLDCHVEHLPWGSDTIPKCSRCHDPGDQKHFTLENCLGCHTNPHMPIASLKLLPDAKTQCGTCHEQELAWIEQNPSKHAEKSCVFCHWAHGKIPNCSKCHEPHLAGQTMENCLSCHRNPHKPLNILPPDNTPVAYCGACHDEIAAKLVKMEYKHGKLLCVYCHKGQHPTVPKCQDCHGTPHGAGILKGRACLDCHRDPHDLLR